ncbi:response regulator [Shouchella patagoniensis]|uniref:response regulator n=1 Tax=Shouchella patagoniensis TaxID=228576 RepID=UPI0009958FF5|nr:response regulator [Shouchella patagoniensis]
MIRVAMIEDDPDIARFNQKFLEKVPGFALIAQAQTVDEGLKAINQTEPDLVLLDVYIGNENGLTILKQLRTEDRNIDVILITSANDAYTVQTGQRFGVIDYLVKPFSFARFKEALERYKTKKADATHALFGQGDIDSLLHTSELSRQKELPKGITKETALRILVALEEAPVWQTAAQLEEKTGISHVSLRKYMRFFEQGALIKKDLVYLNQGRPLNQYVITEQGKTFFEKNDFV